VTFFTDLKKFIVSLSQDKRLPGRDKKIIFICLVLIICPFDFIPDWKPLIGLVDDFILLAVVLDYFFSVLDGRIILSHFPWDMKAFARLRRIARGLQFLVPNVLKKNLWLFEGEPY
jgi:hypothetical protein